MNTDPFSIDEAAVLQFVSLLGKQPETARFRFFPHKANPNKAAIGARRMAGWNAAQALAYQQKGRGAYLVIGNGGDTAKSITSIPALFVEWDDKPLDWQVSAWQTLGLPEPSIQVATGGASIHNYWLLQEPLPPEQWRPLQEQLIAYCGSDPACKDASRVMRLPGCHYIDANGQPIARTEIIHVSDHRYRPEQITACLPAAAPADQQVLPAPAGDLPPRDREQLFDAIKQVPPFHHGEGRREELLGLAFRLWKEIGRDDALALLQRHSPELTDLPDYFRGDEPSQISRGSIWPFLREHYGYDTRRHDLKKTRKSPARTQAAAAPAATGIDAVVAAVGSGWVEMDCGRCRSTLAKGDLSQCLTGKLANRLEYDELELMPAVDRKSLSASDVELLHVRLSENGWKITEKDATDGLMLAARRSTFHPIRDYLQLIERDPSVVPFNLDEVAPRFFRATDPLHAAMVRKWLIGAVARAINPGCQMDYCLVLQSDKQGLFKSTTFKALASPDWFCCSMPASRNDLLLNIHRCWIFEFAEFESVTSKKKAGELKNDITTATDLFRVPYGKAVEPRPRASVFCATVNKQEFLNDETGNRRFWVVPIAGSEPLPREELRAARDAIWKAAMQAWRAGEVPCLPPELEAVSEARNEDHTHEDPWLSMLRAWVNGSPAQSVADGVRPVSPDKPFAVADALVSAGLRRHDQINKADENRCADCLRQLGFTRRQVRHGKQRIRQWERSLSQPAPTGTTSGAGGCAGAGALQRNGSQLLSQPEQPLLEEGSISSSREEEEEENRGRDSERGCAVVTNPQIRSAAVDLPVTTPPKQVVTAGGVVTGRSGHRHHPPAQVELPEVLPLPVGSAWDAMADDDDPHWRPRPRPAHAPGARFTVKLSLAGGGASVG